MKKMFFLLACGVLILMSSSVVFAMNKGAQEFTYEYYANGQDDGKNCDSDGSNSEGGGETVEEYDDREAPLPTYLAFSGRGAKTTKLDLFRKHYHKDKHLGCSYLLLNEEDYEKLKQHGWYIFPSKDAFDKASQTATSNSYENEGDSCKKELILQSAKVRELQEEKLAREASSEEQGKASRDSAFNDGKKERERKMSFCERHPKKLIFGAVVLTGLSVKAVDYWFANRK